MTRKEFFKEYFLEYSIQVFLIIGSILIAQRIEQLLGDDYVKFVLGACLIALAALLTTQRKVVWLSL